MLQEPHYYHKGSSKGVIQHPKYSASGNLEYYPNVNLADFAHLAAAATGHGEVALP